MTLPELSKIYIEDRIYDIEKRLSENDYEANEKKDLKEELKKLRYRLGRITGKFDW